MRRREGDEIQSVGEGLAGGGGANTVFIVNYKEIRGLGVVADRLVDLLVGG